MQVLIYILLMACLATQQTNNIFYLTPAINRNSQVVSYILGYKIKHIFD